MIKPIDWISCEQCKKDLQEFKDLTPLSEEMIETLDAYTLFLELKQLRRSKVTTNTLHTTRGLDTTVMC
jgi:hypothetical protein